MSRTTKIVLGVVAGLLVLCICGAIGVFWVLGRTVSSAVSSNSGDAAATGQQIADYTLPAGWTTEGAMHLLGVSMVFIRMGSSDGVATLMQMPGSYKGNETLLLQQMRQAAGRNLPGQVTEVGQQQVTLRGQPATLTVSEGTNSTGRAYRELSGTFQGKSGTAMLMIVAPADQWNQPAVDSFLASVR